MAVPSGMIDIKAPLITSDEPIINPLRITIDSPKTYRKAVYRLALYFKREFHYDFEQFAVDDEDRTHIAFLWIHPEAIELSCDYRVPCIGATCFRYREPRNRPSTWGMQWVWFHPYFRRQGLLRSAWSNFKEEFGDFRCAPPLSDSMTKFLEKIDTQNK